MYLLSYNDIVLSDESIVSRYRYISRDRLHKNNTLALYKIYNDSVLHGVYDMKLNHEWQGGYFNSL